LDQRHRPRLVVVPDGRPGVEGLADAVPGEVTDHAVTEPLGVGLDHPSDHADRTSRSGRLDASHHRLVGALGQVADLFGWLAGEVGATGVAVHTVQVGGDVDLDHVA